MKSQKEINISIIEKELGCLLKNFLIKKNVYEEYLDEAEKILVLWAKSNGRSFIEEFQSRLYRYQSNNSNALNATLCWDRTKRSIWRQLHMEYQSLYTTIKIRSKIKTNDYKKNINIGNGILDQMVDMPQYRAVYDPERMRAEINAMLADMEEPRRVEELRRVIVNGRTIGERRL